MTCTRLSFHGKPSFRLGIKHIVLTLCRRGLVILIYLHILLGFLNLLGIYIVLLSLSYYPLKDIKPFFVRLCDKVHYCIFIVWYIFRSLPLGIQLIILFRLYLILSGLFFEFLPFTLHATPNSMSLSYILNSTSTESTGGSNSSPGNGPPHNEASSISGANSSDLLIRKCYNQLQIPVKYQIWDHRHTPDCRLDTVELRNEICIRYVNAGSPGGYKLATLPSGELRLRCFNNNLNMTEEIFNAIKR